MVFQRKPLASAAAASIVLAFGAVIPPQVAHADPSAVASARAKAQDASAAAGEIRPILKNLCNEPGVRAAVYVRGATALVQGPRGATAERRIGAGPGRSLRERLDRLDEGVSGRNIDPRIRIGYAVMAVLFACAHAASLPQ